MAKKKSKNKRKQKKKKDNKSGKKRKSNKSKKRKSAKPKKDKKKVAGKARRKKKKTKKKQGKVIPPGSPGSKHPKKKPPKKRRRKWPPRRKRPKGSGGDNNSDLLQFADFSSLVGTTFRLVDFDPPVPVELIEIEALDPPDVPDDLETEIRAQPFSLLFEGPLNVELPQDAYSVEHPSLEPFVIFMVPVGPPASEGDFQIELEAIFG